MSQEEIIKLIEVEETWKKATGQAERGKSTIIGNEHLGEISKSRINM